MLLAFWSPKGGVGTSTLAAGAALVLARHGGSRLADLAGDQPALLGLPVDPGTGLAEWLDAGPTAPSDALGRLAVQAAPGLALLPRGCVAERALAPVAAAEAGAALAVALRDGGAPTVVDAGTATAPAARALVEVADASVVVLRPCYLALRRATRTSATGRSAGIAVVEEPHRALGAAEAADVLGRPVLARVPWRESIARAVDAGVLASRPPDALVRPVTGLLSTLGMLDTPRGRAA